MRKLLQGISLLMLVLTVLLPLLYLFDMVSESAMKTNILIVTVLWFVITPLWARREKETTTGNP
ncbi:MULTISPECIES: hypothetical protein [unclassified Halomonas]|uniref:hypothetical protein n=1 Tax=unclassified Halomonas TaxID=2609666 RepID=UPI00209D56B6|nr:MULTISPECIES: hypothetical protein [unclassified Halomonas]MCP1312850.1 hypothetical protein [Halomonas sp. 707D7]MCP1325643.1 hypothetical protein [Halomonas sp. 707D4]